METVLGIEIAASFEQPLKISLRIVVKPGLMETPLKSTQFKNALLFIVLIELGMVIDLNPEEENAPV